MTLILSGTNGLSDVDGDASTPAIRGTDANTGMFFGSDIVGLSTGGSERMRIDSSGNVGIGGTATANGAGYTTFGVNGTTAGIIEHQANGVRQAQSYATTTSFVTGSLTAIPMVFTTDNAERARITSDGYFRMASGSGGIQFNGDTAAANALDDYEEGTWTPALYTTGITPSITYTQQIGNYVKVGKSIILSFRVTMSVVSGAQSGTVRINIPFSNFSGSSTEYQACGSMLLTDGITGGGIVNVEGNRLIFSGSAIAAGSISGAVVYQQA